MHKFLQLAFDEARAHPFDPSMEYQLCAVIAKGGKVLSTGYNHRGWHGLSERYKSTAHLSTIHAEVDAILLGRKKIRFEGAKIFIVRIRTDGSVGLAKPCKMCQQVLLSYGIKKAYYTTEEFPFFDSMRIVKLPLVVKVRT